MMKVALLAAAVGIAASAATATNTAPDSASPAPAETACRPGQTLELACALRVADANGDGTVSPAELANLSAPAASAPDWTPLRPPSTGLDFKDAATDSRSVLPAMVDSEHSRPLATALLALGALVILLRRRPG